MRFVVGVAVGVLYGVVTAGAVVVVLSRLAEVEKRLMALNDAQQAELLSAVSGVGQDVTELADRIATLIATRDADDPDVTQAIADLRATGQRIDSIATEAQAPPTDTGSTVSPEPPAEPLT